MACTWCARAPSLGGGAAPAAPHPSLPAAAALSWSIFCFFCRHNGSHINAAATQEEGGGGGGAAAVGGGGERVVLAPPPRRCSRVAAPSRGGRGVRGRTRRRCRHGRRGGQRANPPLRSLRPLCPPSSPPFLPPLGASIPPSLAVASRHWGHVRWGVTTLLPPLPQGEREGGGCAGWWWCGGGGGVVRTAAAPARRPCTALDLRGGGRCGGGRRVRQVARVRWRRERPRRT